MTEFKPDWVSAPGDTIQELLEEKSISVNSFAKRLKEPTHVVQQLLDGTLAIDGGMALKLERIFGASREFWLKRQENYDKGKKRLGL